MTVLGNGTQTVTVTTGGRSNTVTFATMADFTWPDVFFGGRQEIPPLDKTDTNLLTALLSGEAPDGGSNGLVARWVRPPDGNEWWAVFSSRGGYNLLTRSHGKSPYLLNLDIAVLVDEGRTDSWRAEVLRIEEELRDHPGHIDVIPVGMTALATGLADRASVPRSIRDSIRLIHREGLECVFTLDFEGELRYYLSAYDDQEDPPLYFLCRLPSPVETVSDARDALMPMSVKVALSEGKAVRRQGDLFAIKSAVTDEDIFAAGGRITDLPDIGPTTLRDRIMGMENLIPNREDLSLYGTAHTATRIAELPNGMMLASGSLMHVPAILGEGRRADHRPMKLDDGWWFVTKNTVPVSGRQRVRQRW
jgi:hypothetical protein